MLGTNSPSMNSLNGINIPSSSSSASVNSVANALASPASVSATLVKAKGESSHYPANDDANGNGVPIASSAGSRSPSTMTVGRAASRRGENRSYSSSTNVPAPTSPSFFTKTLGRMGGRRSISGTSNSSSQQTGGLSSWFSPNPNNSNEMSSAFNNINSESTSQPRQVVRRQSPPSESSQAGNSGFTQVSNLSVEDDGSSGLNATSPRSNESASQLLRRLKTSAASSSSSSGVHRIQAHPNFSRKGKGKASE